MTAKGILGTKLGMTQVFDDENRVIPVTVVEAGPCTVTQVKTPDTDGYSAIQIAFGSRKHVNKPSAGHLARRGSTRRRHSPSCASTVTSTRPRSVRPSPATCSAAARRST